jgi:hypothetical protein
MAKGALHFAGGPDRRVEHVQQHLDLVGVDELHRLQRPEIGGGADTPQPHVCLERVGLGIEGVERGEVGADAACRGRGVGLGERRRRRKPAERGEDDGDGEVGNEECGTPHGSFSCANAASGSEAGRWSAHRSSWRLAS